MVNFRSLRGIFKKPKPDWPTLPLPDDSINFFEVIKAVTEKYWIDTIPNKILYGFQVQGGSTWRPGLNDTELADFEKRVGLEFPSCLKNFYKVMNGLTLPGINVYGSSGHEPAYRPLFYSYPDDLPLIEDIIAWVYEANNVDRDLLKRDGISSIFPIIGHRFMLMEVPGNPILSMHGNDIIYWAENLSKCIANESIDNIWNASDFESNPEYRASIKFWLD